MFMYFEKQTQPDLSMMEVNSIHGQFLCILQKVNFSLCWSHPPVGRRKSLALIHHSRAVKQSIHDFWTARIQLLLQFKH